MHTSHTRTLCLLLLAFLPPCLDAALAPTQLLDLDAGKPPEPNTGRAVLADIDALNTRIATLENDPETSDAILAANRLARTLLTTGEQLAEPGSTHVISAWRLLGAIDDIENLAERTDDPALPHALGLFADNADAFIPPSDPDDLHDALRSLLALLAEYTRDHDTQARADWTSRATTAGWTATSLDDPAARADWRKWIDTVTPALAPEAAGTITDLDDLTRTAETWWAYRRTGDDLRLTLTDAWAPLTILEADRFPPALERELRSRFSAAAANLADPATRTDGRDTLLALTTIRTLIELADSSDLARDRQTGPAIQDALQQLIRKLLDDPLHAELRGRAAIRLFAHFNRHDTHDERAVAQALRPAFRTLDENADTARRALLAVLEPALLAEDAATDPEVIAAVSAFERTIEDLDAVVAIHRWLEDQDILDDRARRLADARILNLSKQIARDDAGARRELIGLGDLLSTLDHDPTVTAMRSGDDQHNARMNQVTGNRHAALISRLDNRISAWARAWAVQGSNLETDDDPADLADELRLLLRLSRALHDGVAILTLDDDARLPPTERQGLAASPAVYLAPAVTAALADSARQDLPRLTRTLLDGKRQPARAAVRDHERAHPLRAVIAALHEQAQSRISGAPQLLQLAEPPTARALFADRRADLAAISRYLREYTHAINTADAATANRLRTYLNIRAQDLHPHLILQ